MPCLSYGRVNSGINVLEDEWMFMTSPYEISMNVKIIHYCCLCILFTLILVVLLVIFLFTCLAFFYAGVCCCIFVYLFSIFLGWCSIFVAFIWNFNIKWCESKFWFLIFMSIITLWIAWTGVPNIFVGSMDYLEDIKSLSAWLKLMCRQWISFTM